MSKKFDKLFGARKVAIAMVHLGASPGSPLFDAAGGVEVLVEGARRDLAALTAAGFDAVMFGNENDRPYQLEVDPVSAATMAYVVGRLKPEIRTPFGINLLWDPKSSIAVAAATGAGFVREIFTGVYASDMGVWNPDAGAAMRYRDRLDRRDLALLFNVSAEFAHSLDTRSIADRARSAVFSSIPDAILVSGAITGEAARMEDLEETKRALPNTPVLANTGVNHATVVDVFGVSDGCIVGSALKVDGDTWKPVDPDRAREFMRLVRAAKGE